MPNNHLLILGNGSSLNYAPSLNTDTMSTPQGFYCVKLPPTDLSEREKCWILAVRHPGLCPQCLLLLVLLGEFLECLSHQTTLLAMTPPPRSGPHWGAPLGTPPAWSLPKGTRTSPPTPHGTVCWSAKQTHDNWWNSLWQAMKQSFCCCFCHFSLLYWAFIYLSVSMTFCPDAFSGVCVSVYYNTLCKLFW